MITSSNVPSANWLYKGEYIIPLTRAQKLKLAKEMLDNINSEPVDSE